MWHLQSHQGEIAALKGVQGKKGLPFSPGYGMRTATNGQYSVGTPDVATPAQGGEDRRVVSGIHMEAWRAFLEAHAHVIRLLEAELEAEKALPLTWYDVLVQLEEAHDHRLRMTELADRVLLSKSGLTRLVDRMCDSGLVSRAADDKDKRGVWVSLEPAGLTRLHDAAPVHMRGVSAYFGGLLSESEAAAIAEPLRRIADMARARDA